MPITEMNAVAVLAAAEAVPGGGPVVMLNLVRYNEHADYGGRTDFPACSGQEAYLQRYAPAFNAVAAAEGVTGIQVLYLGNVAAALAAPDGERWDNIVLVQYPSFAAFRTVTESAKYTTDALPHRKAALADWKLIAATQVPMPD